MIIPPNTIFEVDRAICYACLECYDEQKTIQPFHDFLLQQAPRTSEKIIQNGQEPRASLAQLMQATKK